MAVTAPRVPVFLDERRASIERITTLRAEEVASMPLSTARNNDLAFDRCLARFAARAEHLVEVEGAVEAHRRLAVCFFGLVEFVVGDVVGDVAGQASCDTLQSGFALWVRLRVESDVFEVCVAFVAVKAGWVKALTSSWKNAAGDRKGTVSA
jgi:hypothetical protein